MFVTDLKDYLINYEPLKDLIGNRVYPGVLPAKPTLPAVSYFEVSGLRYHDIDVAFPRFQFSCFSPRYLEAKNVAKEIRHALQRFKGQIGDTNVIQGVFENQFELYENDTKLFNIAVDIKIIYREE